MTLHKQLTAAFRPTARPDVALPGQGDRSAEGYFWKEIDFCLVISPSGEIVDVERPPWRMGGKRRRSTLLVPFKPFLGAAGLSGFLWGRSTHAVGVSRNKPDGDLGLDSEGFRHFRAFHRSALSEINSPSIRAFLLFLDRWEPNSLDAVSFVHETAGAALAFRFQYENGFLHECQAARQRWARLLNPAGALLDTLQPSL